MHSPTTASAAWVSPTWWTLAYRRTAARPSSGAATPPEPVASRSAVSPFLARNFSRQWVRTSSFGDCCPAGRSSTHRSGALHIGCQNANIIRFLFLPYPYLGGVMRPPGKPLLFTSNGAPPFQEAGRQNRQPPGLWSRRTVDSMDIIEGLGRAKTGLSAAPQGPPSGALAPGSMAPALAVTGIEPGGDRLDDLARGGARSCCSSTRSAPPPRWPCAGSARCARPGRRPGSAPPPSSRTRSRSPSG